MIVEGRAVLIPGDDVDTDVMYPGQYLNIEDPEKMKPYLFEGYDPSLREQLGPDAILVTGANFGIGSSREHVPLALKAWGVRAVIGKSFARIFRRNCVNLGMPIFDAPEAAAAARAGSRIRIDTEEGEIDVDGHTFGTSPDPPLIRAVRDAGGLIAWAAGGRRGGTA